VAEGKESHSPSLVNSGNWKTFKPTITTVTSQKDIKEKPALKSPKFISFNNKSETSYKPTFMKGEAMDKPI